MSEQDFTLTFSVSESPERVFDAVMNVRGWWSEAVEGGTDRVGDEFTYQHGDLHRSTQVLVESLRARRAVWRVSEAHLSFVDDASEWEGTQLRFEVTPREGATELRFTHAGLVPRSECYGACSKGWGFYVGESLRSLITTGTGRPDRRERPGAQ